VELRKLESTDAFYVLDLPDAARSVGVVRLAPKVLVDGAEQLARSTTYALAAHGVAAGGVSGGINAKPDGRDAAVTSFCEEVAPLVAEGRLVLSPGTGLTADELAPLGCEPLDDGLLARGAAAAARVWGSGSAAVAGPAAAEWADRLGPWWTDTGGTWEGAAETFGAEVNVLFLTGKAGLLDDEHVGTIGARVVVGVTPVPVTAKAYASLNRHGATFVPELVAGGAAWLAAVDPDGGDPVERTARLAGEVKAEGGEPWRVAVARAEAFLSTWQTSLPFGRPLAAGAAPAH
jgi:hypothetical protein